MRTFSAATTPEEQALERVLKDAFPGNTTGLCYAPAVASVASPARQAVDSACWAVSRAGAVPHLFVKVRYADAAPFVDMETAYAASCMAAVAGVAPAAHFLNTALHAIGFDYLGNGWRPARVGDLRTPATLQAVIAAKRTFHAASGPLRPVDVFARIENAAHLAATCGAELAEDFGWMLDNVRDIQAALSVAPHDLMPCHGDGTASNVMLGPNGTVRLVDFDASGLADPLYDIGILLNEVFQFDTEMQAALKAAFPAANEADYQRCRVYAIADDLYWGLWGAILAAISPRRDVEFLKYGSWRWLRCRMALRDPRFEERLRRL